MAFRFQLPDKRPQAALCLVLSLQISSRLAALLAPIAIATPIVAQEFLPVEQAAKLLSDSRPWAAVKDGRNARLTFAPDGTGSFEGPVTMPISWSVKGQEICMELRFAGAPCLRFRRIAGGLLGYSGKAEDLRLTR
jgi:hypothetical protein